MGRELRDLLKSNSWGVDVRLITTAEEPGGTLSLQSGEPAIALQLDRIALADADLLLLAGDVESARSALLLAKGTPAIDLSYAAEDDPRSRLRAPMTENHDFRVSPDAIQSIAHPAAIALALLLKQLDAKSEGRFQIQRWAVHIFEPASERGAAGIQELQEQTVNLLSFKPLPKKIFDSQLSYSLLAELGEEAPVQLEHVESRIERHLATLLQNSGIGPMPSIRLIQAPVFHGYSISVWLEFSGEIARHTGFGSHARERAHQRACGRCGSAKQRRNRWTRRYFCRCHFTRPEPRESRVAMGCRRQSALGCAERVAGGAGGVVVAFGVFSAAGPYRLWLSRRRSHQRASRPDPNDCHSHLY